MPAPRSWMLFRLNSMGSLINNPLFRPPAEAESLILQVDSGCPYNRCTFCGMYSDMEYSRLALPDVRRLIERECRRAPDTRRVFLADGDVMRRPFEDLEMILADLATHLPYLARVNIYASGCAIAAKSDAQLSRLRGHKLHTLYMGLESGDDVTLRHVRKAETAAVMIDACSRAQASGLRMSVMLLLGLGGMTRTHEHADATADALNRMQPRLLSALRVVPVPGTELFREVQAGQFVQLTEHLVVEELRRIVSGLDLTNTVFRANHASNVVPIEARFPRDKARLLAQLDDLLTSGCLDRGSPGVMPLWL